MSEMEKLNKELLIAINEARTIMFQIGLKAYQEGYKQRHPEWKERLYNRAKYFAPNRIWMLNIQFLFLTSRNYCDILLSESEG